MRYSAEHKQETRNRIVRAAERQFCRPEGKGSAIADRMRELGLTDGGFYKHFDSKQQLLAEAIKKTFGNHAYKLAFSSTKSMTGHLLGAAAGVESVFTVLAIHKRRLSPTIRLNRRSTTDRTTRRIVISTDTNGQIMFVARLGALPGWRENDGSVLCILQAV